MLSVEDIKMTELLFNFFFFLRVGKKEYHVIKKKKLNINTFES